MPLPTFDLQPARPADAGAVHAMIRALADFERLSHLCVATESDLADAGSRSWFYPAFMVWASLWSL